MNIVENDKILFIYLLNREIYYAKYIQVLVQILCERKNKM